MQASYDSLAAIGDASDLVVLGTLTGIRPGRDVEVTETKETEYQATITVRVDEVLKGRPVEAAAGALQVEFLLAFSPGSYDPWAKSAPIGDRVVLFLVNKGAEATRLGLAPDAPGWGVDYYTVRNGQGFVRDAGGTSQVKPDADPWLLALSGRPFDEVVSEVRATLS